MTAITAKIYRLIDLMHDPAATPAARFRLLLEIGEDAQRLRIGSDDKIKFAGRTADDVGLFPCRLRSVRGYFVLD